MAGLGDLGGRNDFDPMIEYLGRGESRMKDGKAKPDLSVKVEVLMIGTWLEVRA